MSTLIGTSRAVVVGSGSGPGPASPPPPVPAADCWAYPTYLDDFTNRTLNDGTWGCSSAGYPYYSVFGPNGSLPDLSIGSGFWTLRVTDPAGFGTLAFASLDLPLDCSTSTITYYLTERVGTAAVLMGSSFEVDVQGTGPLLKFYIESHSDGFGTPTTIVQATNQDTGVNVVTTGSGWLVTSPSLVTISITPTAASVSVADLLASVPCVYGTVDPNSVVTTVELRGRIDCDPTLAPPNSAFLVQVSNFAISTALGNCQSVSRC